MPGIVQDWHNRTRIDEANGIGRQYTYDRLYRLTKEQVVDPANAQTYQNDFSYDAVGNRLNKTYAAYNQSAVSNGITAPAAGTRGEARGLPGPPARLTSPASSRIK